MRFIHFVVLEYLDQTWVRLNDPLIGPRRMRRSEFDRQFTGVALSLSLAAERDRSRPAQIETHTNNEPFRLGRALWETLKPIRSAPLFACLPAAFGGALLAIGLLVLTSLDPVPAPAANAGSAPLSPLNCREGGHQC